MSSHDGRRAAIADWLNERAQVADRKQFSVSTGRISMGQRGLWFQSRLRGTENSGSAFCYRLHGRLDQASLAAALRAVVERHEPLRTRYVYQADEPVMVIDPVYDLNLDLVHASPPDGAADFEWLVPAIQDYVSRPFDLAEDAALRVRLWQLSVDEHVLAFVVHHIAFDGWSLGIFQNELSHCYEQIRSGAPPTLPELATTYERFAEEQRLSVETGDFVAHADYWRSQLRSVPPFLDLPTDRPRPTVQSFTGDLQPFAVSAELCDGLSAVGDEERASLAMSLVAGYALFLARWARQDEVVIGVPVANRSTAQVEPLIGMFVNLLPIRVWLDTAPTFRSLLRQVRTTMLAAFDHQALPFDQMVQEHRKGDADQASTPVVNVALALQTVDRGRLVFGDVIVEPLMVHERTSIFDLTLTMAPDRAQFAGYLEFSRDLFEPNTISRMCAAFERTLRYCATEPDAPLAELALAEPELSEQTLPDETLHDQAASGLLERFLAAQQAAPDLPAAKDTDGEITYGELRAAVETLAEQLGQAGVTRGTIVGVHLEPGRDLVTAFLAVLWVGAVYLPLDPQHPLQRLTGLVEDSGTGHVVTDADDPWWGEEVAVIRPAAGSVATSEPTSVEPADPAYLIYTSGSTGRPKGVLLSRGGLDNLVAAQDDLPVDGLTRFATVAAPSFDASIWEMILPLGRNGRLDFCSPETLSEDLAEFRTEVLTCTPSLLSATGKIPPSVRVVISAGEVLPAGLARTLAASAAVVNAYGPTETTVCASMSTTARGQDVATIGTALRGMELHLLDENMRAVPDGAVGEICVSGAGLAIGYQGDPGLTSSRFVTADVLGGRRGYLTGDLGRRGPDGCISYLGRTDDQVKLHGQRLQLSDVESAARATPGVGAACAYLGTTSAGRHLGLAITPTLAADGGQVVDAVTRSCEARLPAGLVPSHIWVCAELPRTRSGKTDRSAVAATAPTRPTEKTSAQAQPSDEIQAAILEIWRMVLAVPDVDVTCTLYSLGGQSLQAVRIITEVRKQLGVRVPIRDFLAQPTVTALADRVREGASQ